ncbi:TonB family protein [Candidatus Sulfopaludibacter sp. SbA3]|nr:TonB family protein [Candidatus Sulfopaludibacter sp. SbA3]
MTGLDVLMQCAWKGSVLLCAGFATNALLRRRSAALRHTVWTVCLAALLALPVAILTMPEWGVLGRRQQPAVQVVQTVPVARVTVTEMSVPVPTPVPLPALVWMAGAAAIVLWFLLGVLRTSWIVRRAAPAGDAAELSKSLGIGRRVRVLASAAAPMPMTWGLVRPVVVLPSGTEGWSAARLHAVLLHELVHVRRLDLLAQGLGQAACCLYWFHPLAWIAARQLRDEREQACDDAVLARGIPAPEYAGHLMDLVRAMAARRGAWAQAPAMAEASGLESRVRALLDSKRDRRPLNLRKAVAVGSVGAALLLPLAALSEVPQTPVAAAPRKAEVPSQAAAPVPNIPYRTFRRPKVVAMASAAEPTPPQVTRGALVGTVRDPSGAVIPGCTVVAANTEGSNQETAMTDAVGQYRFNNILAGPYSLEVHAPGFAAFKLPQVQVTAGNVALVNANLETGAVSQTLTVQGKRPATVTPSVTAPERIKVGGNVQQARLVRQVRPVYPSELQQLGVEGTVMLRAIISREGIPMSLRAVSSSVDERLVDLAMDAVRQWRYQPMLLNGEPVETVTTIDVTFTLQ